MRTNKAAVVAWVLCAVVVLVTVFQIVQIVFLNGNPQALGFLVLFGPIAAIVSALIIARQPRNAIGWLLMTPCVALALGTIGTTYVQSFANAPSSPSVLLWFLVLTINLDWILLIFPLLLIVLLYPTGEPLTPRWQWVVWFTVGLAVIFPLIAGLSTTVHSDPNNDASWLMVNPIGVFSAETVNTILTPWQVGLATVVILSVVSLFLRYRRAMAVEKAQIKWLLFVCALFLIVYIPQFFINQTQQDSVFGQVLNVGFGLTLLLIPVAIGIAILRYRLFDIDVIIRRTLTYGLVTALLLVVYFGSVVVLQKVFTILTGIEQNPIVTVISTLGIAALFIPLRNRVQTVIDRRFNRRRYDAQRVLQHFAATVRDETDLERLSNELVDVVNETMQPKSVGLWLRRETRMRDEG